MSMAIAHKLGTHGIQELHAKDLGDGEVLTEKPARWCRQWALRCF